MYVGGTNGSNAFVFVSAALLPVPVPAPPPVTGLVGIGAPVLLPIVPIGPDAIADTTIPTPASPALAGTVWPIQGVVATPSGQFFTNNTAKLRLQ